MPVELTEEEKAVEAACDEERYLELVTDVQEKAMYEEEEWKRYYESLHEGTYKAVGFSYEQPSSAVDQAQEMEEAKEEVEEEVFVPPEQLMVPDDITVPQTEKEHARIERTAAFIAKHGAQMEIRVKMKQSNNMQFEFLNFEKPLNQYYQHLLKMIKSGKYRPQHQQEQKSAEQDAADQHYLHPSLSTITALPPPPPPKPIVMPKFSIEDTAYGQLVSSLKKYHRPKEVDKGSLGPPPLPPFMAQPDYGSSSTPLDTLPSSHSHPPTTTTTTTTSGNRASMSKEERVEPPPPGTEVMGPLPQPASLHHSHTSDDRSPPQPQIVPPPPDVQPIIDRMAMYVAKNGVEFEFMVKSKNDPRFAFLEASHVHFQYYDFKKNMFLKEAELKKRLEAKQAERERLKQQQEEEEAAAAQANRSISFSIRGRSKDPESVSTLKRPLFDYDSSDGEGGEGEEGVLKEDGEESKSGSHSPSPAPVPTTTITTSITTPASMATAVSAEVKAVGVEDVEKKQAEERLKDKLATAARDKLAACSKERQLQTERKKKAAMFINLLRIVKESPASAAACDKGGEGEVKPSPGVTPTCSKPSSPVPEVFEYNNRSGTPTLLTHNPPHRASRSKSPAPSSRRKRRKKSRTPPSAYANPLRSPPRFTSSLRRSHSPRRGLAGSRRVSPIRPFRSRRSPSPPGREWSPLPRSRSPLRKKVNSKRSRSRSQSPSQSKHKKKHKRSRSKTPKKKKKDRTREAPKAGRGHDRAADKQHKDRDKKKEREKKKERGDRKDRERGKERGDRKGKERKERKDKERSKSGDGDNNKHSGAVRSERPGEKGKDTGSSQPKPPPPPSSSSSSSAPAPAPSDPKPPPAPSPALSAAKVESAALSPVVPEVVTSSSSDSSSSSEDEGQEKGVGGEGGGASPLVPCGTNGVKSGGGGGDRKESGQDTTDPIVLS
ncbi:splicing factor, suppressor of white-apricot homolog isoform X2 [Babylonia areolata]